MRRLLVFDLDDTLYLERDFVRSGFRAVDADLRRRLGMKGFFPAAWRRFEAGERGDIFDRVLAEKDVVSRRLIRELVAVYRNHGPRVSLCPDARRFLQKPPRGSRLAIISDGPLRAQEGKVRALGLHRLVEAVILTGRWAPRFAKPHPRSFLALQKRFEVDGEACAYIADNPAKDFQAPLALRWTAIRMRRPGGLHASVPGPPIPEVRSCDELRGLLP